MAEIKLTLIENAENFLVHSLSQAIVAEKDSQNWKYAILHLVQSIELSLKELLKKEHSILIYRNVDKPKETVSLEYAVARLQNIAKLNFNSDDLEKISLASNIRNAIVHYEFSFKEEEIKPIYAKLIGFLQYIFYTHFNKNLSTIIDNKIWEEAVTIIEYTNELQKRAEGRFKSEGIDEYWIIQCRRCHQKSFVFKNDINRCYVCDYIDKVNQCNKCFEIFYLDELYQVDEVEKIFFCFNCRDNKMQRYHGSS